MRVPFLDNAKFLLIVLVVMGHTIEPFAATGGLRALFYVIYAFHMPAFVLLAGYLTRSPFGRQADYFRGSVATLVWPFALMSLVYAGYRSIVWGFNPDFWNLLAPYWILWFPLALLFWRGLLPFVLSFRHPLLLSVALGLAIGLARDSGTYLTVTRTFVFLPFFVAGHLLRDSQWFRERPPWAPFAGIVILLAVGLSAFFLPGDARWLLGADNYWGLEVGFRGIFFRLGTYALAGVTGLAFFSLVPRRRVFFSELGRYTLVVFLLHGLVLLGVGGTVARLGGDQWQPAILLAESVLMPFVLSWPFVARPLDRILRFKRPF